MPLAGGAEAQNDARGSLLEVTLVWVGHDGRIEEGGRLNGVFVREVGANQTPPLLRQLHVLGQIATNLQKVPAKDLPNVLVTRGEAGDDLFKHTIHLFFGQSENPIDDLSYALVAPRRVELGDHPGGLGDDPLFRPAYRQSFPVHRFSFSPVRRA